jgi:hypothetical protein
MREKKAAAQATGADLPPPISKIHPFSKIVVTFLGNLECPLTWVT